MSHFNPQRGDVVTLRSNVDNRAPGQGVHMLVLGPQNLDGEMVLCCWAAPACSMPTACFGVFRLDELAEPLLRADWPSAERSLDDWGR